MLKVDLSVIIVNWNTCSLLMQCIDSIQGSKPGYSFDIWVIDNHSTDDSVQMIRQDYPTVSLIGNTENVGFSRANNQALRLCSGRYVLLLNSDAFVQENALARMIQFMEAHAEAGIVGANLFYPDGRPQMAHGPLPSLVSEMISLLGLDRFQRRAGNGLDKGWIETGVVGGACLLARRSMLDQIGLLDERYFMFSEEIDLCRRAHQAGWKVAFLPSARVIHLEGGSTGRTPERILRLYRSKLLYFEKHHGQVAHQVLFAAIRLATILKVITFSICGWLVKDRRASADFWRQVLRKLPELKVSFESCS